MSPGQWEISGRAGYDGNGWLWLIRRGEWPDVDVRRVLIEVSATASHVDKDRLPPDTAEAIATEGESEVMLILGVNDPPRVIQCGTTGCRPAGDEASR